MGVYGVKLLTLFFFLAYMSACQTDVRSKADLNVTTQNSHMIKDQSQSTENRSTQLTDNIRIDACRVDTVPCPATDVISNRDKTDTTLEIHSNRVDISLAEGTACQIALDSTNVHQHTDRERSIVVSAMNKPMHCVYSCETGDTSEGCPQPTVQQVNFIYVGLRHVGRATLIEIGDKPAHYYRNKRFLVPRQ